MNREDCLKDYYRTLEEAPIEVLEEHEGNTIAALQNYNAMGDKKQVKEFEADLKFSSISTKKVYCIGSYIENIRYFISLDIIFN